MAWQGKAHLIPGIMIKNDCGLIPSRRSMGEKGPWATKGIGELRGSFKRPIIFLTSSRAFKFINPGCPSAFFHAWQTRPPRWGGFFVDRHTGKISGLRLQYGQETKTNELPQLRPESDHRKESVLTNIRNPVHTIKVVEKSRVIGTRRKSQVPTTHKVIAEWCLLV